MVGKRSTEVKTYILDSEPYLLQQMTAQGSDPMGPKANDV
jgi:hypothetical protein